MAGKKLYQLEPVEELDADCIIGVSEPEVGSHLYQCTMTQLLTWLGNNGLGSVTDHGYLTGLSDDDHTQYTLLAPTTSARNVIQPTLNTVIPLVIKGAASQSAAHQSWQDSAGTVLAAITDSANASVTLSFKPSTPGAAPHLISTTAVNGVGLRFAGDAVQFLRGGGVVGQFVVGTGDAVTAGFHIGSHLVMSGGTDSRIRGEDASGSNTAATTLVLSPGKSTGSATPAGITLQGSVAIGSGSTAQTLVDIVTVSGATQNVLVNSTAATVIPLVIKGAASQSAGLLSIQNSSSTELVLVGSTGILWLKPQTGVMPSIASIDSGNGAGIKFTGDVCQWVHGAGVIMSFVYGTGLDLSPYSQNLTLGTSSLLKFSTDSGIARNAAGVLEINSGTAGVFRDLKLRNLILQASANNRLTNNKVLYGATTDAVTAVELTSDGAAGSGSTNRIAVPADTAMSVILNICVKQSGSANAFQMLRQFVISNNGGTTALQGSVTTLGTDIGSAGLATVTCTITANNTDDCIKVEVNGVAATNLRYTCSIVSAETLYA